MKTKSIISLLILLSVMTSTLSAAYTPQEKKDATKTWLKGFEYFEKADKALQNGQLRQANTMFKMAVSIFEKVGLRYPKWNTSLISYRIKLCRLKLMKIKDELAKKHIKLTDTDVDKENLELKDRIDELTEKLNKARKELSTALYSLESARREAARNVKSSNETSDLLREKTQLQKRCALLESDNKRLQKSGGSAIANKTGKQLLDKTLLQIDRLKKENAGLNALLIKERSDFANLAKKRVRIQYEKKLGDDDKKRLTNQVEILNARIVEMRVATKKASEQKSVKDDEMKKLSAKLAKMELELEGTRDKLKHARLQKNSTAIVKQLENENELLLKDVELSNINLERSEKSKKITDAENRRLKANLKKLKESLAAMDADRSKTTSALEVLSKKLFLASTIVKKQKKALSERQKQFNDLKSDSDKLAKQYAETAKKDKAFAEVVKENAGLKVNLTKLETSISTIRKEEKRRTLDFETSNKKLFIANAVVKKQKVTIEQERKEATDLKKRCDDLTKKYSSMDKKEKAFSELAKRSLETESENTTLTSDLKTVRSEIATQRENSKKQAMRIIQLQEELQKLISENANANRGIISKNSALTEKTKALSEQLEIIQKINQGLKKNNREATRKLLMVTQELVASKANVGNLSKRLAVAMQRPKTTPTPLKTMKATPKEPSIALIAGKLVKLKRRNSELLSTLQEQKATLNKLSKEKNAALKAACVLSPTEKKRIDKMLDSAALAENEKKKEAAIWYYEKVLEDDPENSVALAKLAYIKAEKGDDGAAIKLINKALAATPDDLELLQTLAVCYSRKKEYYKALGAAAKANAINPKNPVTQRYLGIICSHLGWVDAAKRQFRSSFKLDPTSSETAYNAAVLLLTTKGGLPEAKLWYDKAVQLGAQRDPKIEELFVKPEKKK